MPAPTKPPLVRHVSTDRIEPVDMQFTFIPLHGSEAHASTATVGMPVGAREGAVGAIVGTV